MLLILKAFEVIQQRVNDISAFVRKGCIQALDAMLNFASLEGTEIANAIRPAVEYVLVTHCYDSAPLVKKQCLTSLTNVGSVFQCM